MKAKMLIACGVIAGFLGAANATMSSEASKAVVPINSMMEVANVSPASVEKYKTRLLPDLNEPTHDWYWSISGVFFNNGGLPTPYDESWWYEINCINSIARRTKEGKNLLSSEDIDCLIENAVMMQKKHMNRKQIYGERGWLIESEDKLVEFFCIQTLYQGAKKYDSRNKRAARDWNKKLNTLTKEIKTLVDLPPVASEQNANVERNVEKDEIRSDTGLNYTQTVYNFNVQTPSEDAEGTSAIGTCLGNRNMQQPTADSNRDDKKLQSPEKKGDDLIYEGIRKLAEINPTLRIWGRPIAERISRELSHEDLRELLKLILNHMAGKSTEQDMEALENVREYLLTGLQYWGWRPHAKTLTKPLHIATLISAVKQKCHQLNYSVS